MILSHRYGKLKAAGSVAASVFVLWLGLALFYRTGIGMPIGVQNYLYHKYWEEFYVNSFNGATIAGHPTNQLTCCPKNGNPTTDAFNVVRKNTLSIGSRLFASDNYYGIIIRDDYEEFVSQLLAEYFDEFEVSVNFNWSGISNIKYMSDILDKSISFDEFLFFQKNSGESCNSATIEIRVPQKYYEKMSSEVYKLAEKIKNKSNYIIIYIFYCNDYNEATIGYTDVLINSKGDIFINDFIKEA